MRNKIISSAIVLLFSAMYLRAQDYTGTVLDENKQPFPYVNVMLLQPDSTTLVAGNVTNDDGTYHLKSGLKGLLLKVSFIGYKSVVLKAETAPQIIELEPDAKLLSEVVVTSSRKIYEIKGSSIIADVQNSLLATLPTTTDLIAELPFVAAMGALGKGESLFYINGRQIRDASELERLSPKSIKSVEVITSPGAEYDATIGLVIKITTLRPADDGMSGSALVKEGTGRHFFGNEYVALNYRKGKWDFFGGFNYGHSKKETENRGIQRFSHNAKKFEQEYDISGKTDGKTHIPELGVNYTSGEETSLGIKYTGEFKRGKSTGENRMSSTSENLTTLQDLVLTDKENHSSRHIFNGYLSCAVNDKTTVFLNSDMVLGNNTDDDKNRFSSHPSDEITTHANRLYRLYYIKGLLKYNLTETSNLSIGTEYTFTLNDQKYRITETVSTGLKNESNNTRQNRTAAFLLYEKSRNNFSLNAGLRYENIHLDYFNNDIPDKDASKTYNKLFPNAGITYSNKDKGWTTSLSYEKSIEYPFYHDLRNNITYSTPFFYESGNPMLQPAINYGFTSITSWKRWQLVASYNRHKNRIIRNITQYPEKEDVLLFHPENIPNSQSFEAMLGYAPVIGFWQPRLEAIMMKQWLKLSGSGLPFNKPVYFLRLGNASRFPKDWTVRVNASYMSPGGNIDYFTTKTRFQADARISKNFLNNSLQIELAVNDIFNSYRESGITDLGKYYLSIDKNTDSQQFSLTVTYRFNPVKSKYKGETANDEIKRF